MKVTSQSCNHLSTFKKAWVTGHLVHLKSALAVTTGQWN